MRVPFTNHELHPVYVAGVLIQPSETREVEASFLPPVISSPSFDRVIEEFNQRVADPILPVEEVAPVEPPVAPVEPPFAPVEPTPEPAPVPVVKPAKAKK